MAESTTHRFRTFGLASMAYATTPGEARRIERTFRFRKLREAFAHVQQVAELAEAEGHHPDVSFRLLERSDG